MQGKAIVVTGATSGIGEVAALELARAGARIVFVARDAGRAEATLGKLEVVAPRVGHRAHLADLSSMADTRRVGNAIAVAEPRIDARIWSPSRSASDSRFRSTMPHPSPRTYPLALASKGLHRPSGASMPA